MDGCVFVSLGNLEHYPYPSNIKLPKSAELPTLISAQKNKYTYKQFLFFLIINYVFHKCHLVFMYILLILCKQYNKS